MVRVNPAFRLESGREQRVPRLALTVALMACLLWTGCSGISQGSAISSTSTRTSTQPAAAHQTALPNASVGSSYYQVLPVDARSSHKFIMGEGALPPGLSLNESTGSVSGVPTRTGTFTFVITTTYGNSHSRSEENSEGWSGRTYRIAVVANAKPVTVQISPADPIIAAGGKIQFVAAVGNTSNTAVKWSASAGVISPTGLFTPPANGPKSITVTASSVAQSTAQASTVATITSQNPVTVQISPVDPVIAAGGKLQFAAAVSNTSNTAVRWSASAGIISPSGLFTAPGSGSLKSITITALSEDQSAAKASTIATITSPITPSRFVISTSSVPSAVETKPYSASLTASGGQPPYRWSIASGSLPAGLQLSSSTGMLSGSATRSGTFTFTVQGTDAASHGAQQSLSLLVLASTTSGKICGPPAYGCSRSDVAVVQIPTALPNVGNLAGANTIVTDPDFGNRIVRITDANTDPSPIFKNRTYETAASGSADDNLWNTDSTLFLVQDTGSAGVPFTFNPSTFQAGRLYVSSFPATNGFKLPDGGNWSRVDPNIIYTYRGTAINKYDFSDRNNPPSPQAVYEFTSSANCLPAGFKATWYAQGGVSGDDTVFAMGYSNTGGQGTGVWLAAYKVGSGCSVLNTQTGQVRGDWGAKGTINIADRFTVHNVKLSRDGNWLIVSKTNCTSSTCSAGPYFWQIGTTNMTSCEVGGYCGGHFTEGYTHFVNNNNSSPWASQVIRAFDAPVASLLTTRTPPSADWAMDQHQSWNNVKPGDSVPVLSTTCTVTRPFTAPWGNEIIGLAADGSGKIWRFAHNFITTRSPNFSTTWGIGTVSQDGRFFLFSSDWMGHLGSESGTTTCTLGTNCRGDVFVVELK